MIGFRLMVVPHQAGGEPVDPDFGTGVYGPALTFTTAGAPGPYTVTDTRKRVAIVLTELENDAQGNGQPYRIDFDVTANTEGATVTVDWCDMQPYLQGPAIAGNHYGHESVGRVGGYSTTYRFADFDVVGTITIDNIMIRRIYEFSA
tara:strand:- start:15159 stop:15599 length:441 start_codon:yes stop_codon:yes gene_type:complete